MSKKKQAREDAINLTVAFDAKRALRNNTGLGNYSRYTVNALSSGYPANRYLLFGAGAPGDRVAPLLERKNVELVGPNTSFDRALPSLWRLTWMARQAADAGADVFHGLSNELPLTIDRIGLPSVVTMHDVIWRRFPKDYKPADRRIYDYKYGRSARIADRVIAISERTKLDLMEDFGIKEDKIDVIYQGVDPIFKPASRQEVAELRQRLNLGDAPYLACVGTVQGRKNQLEAAMAMRALPADVRLLIAGRPTAYAREVARYVFDNHLQDRVMWLDSLPFKDLPALYTGAAASLYLSRYEGFGLPVAESLSCGTPVVAATGSCLEEAGGRGALYVSPDDPDECADAVRRILDDSYLRGKLAELGLRHVKQFNQPNFAKKVMTAYRMAILRHAL